jgi:hypothetical protein
MTTPTLDTLTAQFIERLHRGGTVDYTWAVRGEQKTSFWRTIGKGEHTLLNSQHNMYFGVHPCTAVPPTNRKGEKKDPKYVRSQLPYIAAVNCVYGEFDAKRWVKVTDKEAQVELDATSKGTLAEARGRVQESIFLKNPEPYKAQALNHIKALPLAASAIVDSGGGYHVYWFLQDTFMLDSDTARARADSNQKRWRDLIESDDDAKDLVRVLRIPGTYNFKKAYTPNYPSVSFVEINFDLTYALEDIEALLPDEPQPKVRQPRPRATSHTSGNSEPSINFDFGTFAERVAEASLCLKRLWATRWEGYGTWLKIGMALYELGDIGFELWKAGSQQSAKYHVGACEDKWQTFRNGDECNGLTLASLKRWADEDTPDEKPLAPERVIQELETLREEKQTRDQILSHPTLGDREKVAWLATNTYIRKQLQRHSSGSISLSGKRVGEAIGRSASTGSRAIRMLEKHGVLVCDPAPMTLEDGTEVAQMLVQPGPAFDDPAQVQATSEVKQRGGSRPGAGRKAKCDSHPEARVIKKTEISYFCEECGDILYQEPAKYKALAPDEEINFDSEETTVEAAPTSAESATAADVPEINFDSYIPMVNKERNSAISPDVMPQHIAPVDFWTSRDDPPVHSGTLLERLNAATAKVVQS